MTSTEKEFDLAAFVAKNQKVLLQTGAGVLIAGAAVWFWIASGERKAVNAEQAYVSAERSFYSGNPQLAKTDLEGVVTRYGNTTAGVRAAVLLARNRYQDGKPAEGVAALNAALTKSASKPFRAALHALMASGYENGSNFDLAAKEYAAASDATESQAEKESYQADQARALAMGNKKAEALKIWQAIASRETSSLVNEAKLRIGELSVAPAKN